MYLGFNVPHNYLPILKYLKLDSLADRRHDANIKFLTELLNGQIDSPHLLSSIPINVPPRFTRQHTTINLPTSSKNYGLYEPLRRSMFIANSDPSFSISLTLTKLFLMITYFYITLL